ncbi:MAG: 30S ribosomal protein S24e [Nanopusillaceae archaeon]|jgi:small subunit ribosomal protein S24e
MEINILNREKNALLNREEMLVNIEHKGEATPKREELRKKIAAMIGKDEKLIIVEKILTEFGKNRSRAFINVYENENDMKKIEPKHILKRNKIIQ